MKIKSFLLTIVAVAFVCNPCFADPTDSLVNITKWETSEGGNDHTYAILKVTLNWTEANALVPTLIRDGLPGYLATITSQQENDFILNSVIAGAGSQPSSPNQFYLGGVWVGGNWTWQSSEPFSFVNWAPTEPNNPGTETIIAIWGFGETDYRRPPGTWNDALSDDSSEPSAVQWSIVEWGETDTTEAVMSPDPIFVAMSHAIPPSYATIYLGNFGGGRSATSVNLSSLIINGSIAPSSTSIIPSHPRFRGDIVNIQIDVALLLAGYGPLWNTTEQLFMVEGIFDDSTPFSNVALFTVRGHISGDVNLDGSTNIADLFRGGAEPEISETSDIDGSCGKANIVDLTYFVDYIFRGGPPPLPGCTEE